MRAYHFGLKFLVEIDIVVDEAMPLREAHDIGESLQVGGGETSTLFIYSCIWGIALRVFIHHPVPMISLTMTDIPLSYNQHHH